MGGAVCPPAGFHRRGPSRNWTPALWFATTTDSNLRMSISTRSRSGERRPSCSQKMRLEGCRCIRLACSRHSRAWRLYSAAIIIICLAESNPPRPTRPRRLERLLQHLPKTARERVLSRRCLVVRDAPAHAKVRTTTTAMALVGFSANDSKRRHRDRGGQCFCHSHSRKPGSCNRCHSHSPCHNRSRKPDSHSHSQCHSRS